MALASTANYINTGGGHKIFSSTLGGTSAGSTVGIGSWVPVHPKVRGITFQATMLGSSVGAPVAGSVSIQASNDGVNPISSTLGLINFNQVASPAVDGFAIDAHYNFVRAVLNGNTTGSTLSSGSTMSVTASPHNVGGW